MRRVLPDPDVLQMHLQAVVRRVQSTRNNPVHVPSVSKYLLDFITIALLDSDGKVRFSPVQRTFLLNLGPVSNPCDGRGSVTRDVA
jgi:hypothetical protein